VNYADTIPGFNNNDRLGLTTFGSVLLHVVIVLGVGFTAPQILPKTNPLQTLDITLVNTRSDVAPDNPDFLAQANQEGGGDTDKIEIARSPLPANPTPSQSQKLPQAKLAAKIETSRTKSVPEYLTKNQAVQQIVTTSPEPEPVRQPQDKNKLGVVNLSELDQERQRLSAEISEAWQDYLKRPKRKFLSARTKEYKYAVYMQSWILKVERIGNLHYPRDARRKQLRGSVVLDAQISPTGTLLGIDVKRSSGYRILDDAATRSVRLAAPFDAFPENIRREVDILHITRTWQYSGSQLTSR
jgi:protein TonB